MLKRKNEGEWGGAVVTRRALSCGFSLQKQVYVVVVDAVDAAVVVVVVLGWK